MSNVGSGEEKASPREKCPILLVSDDKATIELFRQIAGAERLELHLPETPDEAAVRARRDAPMLVAIDLAGAAFDGWALYDRIRGDPVTARLPMLLLARDEDLAGRIASLRSDVDDYVARPLRAQEIAHRIRHLLARAVAAPRHEAARPTGRIIAICSNKGGVGKTVLAVNLAVALRQRTGKPVAIVDADLYYGNVGTYMGVPPVRSILDLTAVIDEMDTEAADRALIRHASGVRVLLGPDRPDQAAEITSQHIQRVLEFLAGTYDYIVVDCQTVIDHRLMPVLDLATDILLVVTPEMGCLRNIRILLDQLAEAGIEESKIRVVLNRAATKVEIEANDIEQAFKHKVAFSLGSGGRPVILSINRGVPLIVDQPKNPVSQQIMHMAEAFVRQESPRKGR